MRGEKLSAIVKWICTMGSPPHARGKVICHCEMDMYHGITPACAGKRGLVRYMAHLDKDHPRMRGEKFTAARCQPKGKGSPPHARGKVSGGFPCQPHSRITPACAGKRMLGEWEARQNKDHPRMRGEKSSLRVPNPMGTGSPPHARGKGLIFCNGDAIYRITPACAGKSAPVSPLDRIGWDHPRMRGEKPGLLLYERFRLGSPPHARGKDSRKQG